MSMMEKLEALTPEQQKRLVAIATKQELDDFIAETGAALTEEERAAAWNYVKANQKKPEGGIVELSDDELDNVAGGHGGACHNGGREVVTIITLCVHKISSLNEREQYKPIRGLGYRMFCGDANYWPSGSSGSCRWLITEKGLQLCTLPEKHKL